MIPANMYSANVVNRSALTPAEKKPKMVCSVFPEPTVQAHWSGMYSMDGLKAGEECAYYIVGPLKTQMDFANANYLNLEDISAREAALDIIGLSEAKKDDNGKAVTPRTTSPWWERGFFVPAGETPTPEELKAARERLHRWCRARLIEGDNQWATSNKNPGLVDSNAKIAARILRVKREYAEGLEETPDKMRCPACRDEILFGAGLCQKCGAHIEYSKDKVPFWADKPAPAGKQ